MRVDAWVEWLVGALVSIVAGALVGSPSGSSGGLMLRTRIMWRVTEFLKTRRRFTIVANSIDRMKNRSMSGSPVKTCMNAETVATKIGSLGIHNVDARR